MRRRHTDRGLRLAVVAHRGGGGDVGFEEAEARSVGTDPLYGLITPSGRGYYLVELAGFTSLSFY